MDADTRHQLKTNELGEMLDQLVHLRDRRVIYGIAAVTLAILLYVSYRVWSWSARAAVESGWAALQQVDSTDPALGDAPLDQLRQIAGSTANEALSATTRLRLAEALHARGASGDAAKLNEARAELEAITSGGGPAVIRAAAMYQLAAVFESMREMDQARATYDRLTQNPEFAGSPFVSLAGSRRESLDRVPRSITMNPGLPPPPPPPASAPAASAPASAESPAESQPTDPTPADPAGDAKTDADAPAASDAPDDGGASPSDGDGGAR